MKIPFVSPKVFNFVLVIVILNSIVLSQLFYDSWKLAYQRKPNVPVNETIEPHPLPTKVLKKTSLGLDNMIADITWLQTIQYYGSGLPYEKYRKLPELLTTVTDMDQRFVYPYTFGLIILPGEGFAKEATALGYKGMKNPNLKNWEIPYYLAMVEHFNLKNHVNAGKLLQIAADRPGAPEMTKLMAGIYFAKADQRSTAYNLYLVVYKTSKNKYVKERAKKYLDHMNLIFALEKASSFYKENFGNYPSDLQDLVTKGIVPIIPSDPLERGFVIDSNTGIVSDLKK